MRVWPSLLLQDAVVRPLLVVLATLFLPFLLAQENNYPPKSLNWFLRAAKQGDPDAQVSLGQACVFDCCGMAFRAIPFFAGPRAPRFCLKRPPRPAFITIEA